MIAALAAPYGALNGWAVIAAIEATLTIAPPPCGPEVRQRVLAGEEGAAGVDAEHPVPALERPLLDGAEVGMAGGVEDAVDPAELGDGGLDGRADRLLVGDVDLEPDRPLELGRDRLGPAAVEVEHGDPSAFRRESARDGLREPRPRAGGEEHLSLEPHRRLPPRVT